MDFIESLGSKFSWVTPTQIYWSIVACMWIEYFFELYLCYRQNKVYTTRKTIPPELSGNMDQETFEKSRLYGMDKNRFTVISDLYGMVVLTALLSFEGLYHGWQLTGPFLDAFGYWPKTWDREIGQSICFSIIALGFNNVVGLPLALYSTFVLEEKHGFNKQTLGFFVKDFIKKILVSIAIMSPLIALIVKIVQIGGQYFFIWLWVFCFIVLIFLMTIYPLVIAPLFDKYTPLVEGPLKQRIEALAARISFPLTKLYVVEGSKRSAHSNAYLYGFFNNKRIVLYDTLIKGYVSEEKAKSEEEKAKAEAETENAEGEQSTSSGEKKSEKDASKKKEDEKGCDDAEIEAVLGHELGHWKLNHVVQNLVISQVNLLFTFSFFAFFYQNTLLYEAFGFPKTGSKPIILGLIIVLQFLLQIYNTAMGYLMNVLCRRFEYQADAFAVELGYGRCLKGALVKLNKDNLSFPISDPIYSAWHHSHPNLLQRISAIDSDMKKSK
jgi:STE24 endopeptidase